MSNRNELLERHHESLGNRLRYANFEALSINMIYPAKPKLLELYQRFLGFCSRRLTARAECGTFGRVNLLVLRIIRHSGYLVLMVRYSKQTQTLSHIII